MASELASEQCFMLLLGPAFWPFTWGDLWGTTRCLIYVKMIGCLWPLRSQGQGDILMQISFAWAISLKLCNA